MSDGIVSSQVPMKIKVLFNRKMQGGMYGEIVARAIKERIL